MIKDHFKKLYMENNQPTTEQEEPVLSKSERRALKRERKKEEKALLRKKQKTRKMITGGAILLGIGIVVLIIGWLFSQTPKLPPTTMQGHIEQSPPSHILDTAMSEVIQKHMLEHADGEDIPGIIIQYNCKDYTCEPDLVQKLTTIAEEFPEFVYLAPNTYDGKIILTKLHRREVLDDFDEQKIRTFIGN